jgi:SSS family solute:Na+ symporter
MIVINVAYWCLNQFIIQRTLGARSLQEGQKGLMAAAFIKILGIIILVLPGIIAFHLFGPDLPSPDLAYPMLVEAVLPSWLTGFFGAALFGAILSSFNSVLHSTSTLFSVDIYKEWIRPNATDVETVLSGKIAGAVLVLFGICTAPMISFIEGGLFAAMKQYGSVIGTPISTLIIGALFIRKLPFSAALVAFLFGMAFQLTFGAITNGVVWVGENGPVTIHWLHIIGITFILMISIMLLGAWLRPTPIPEHKADLPEGFSLTTWKQVIPAAIAVTIAVFAVYAGLATFAG